MQSFSEWLAMVPETITNDPLWRMKVYRMALFLGDLAWRDVTKLVSDRRTVGLADQLFRAVGSIGANIAKGYSRQSGKDRTRFYEYALGRHVLSEKVAEHRINLLAEIARLLLSIIPQERVRNLAEEPASYEIDLVALLDDPPLPS
jgi:hypothetical protein